MGKYEKLMLKVLQGLSDKNVAFNDLRAILKKIGFSEFISGSHHIYRMEGVEERINLQKDGAKAKPYQVKQVRAVILKYRLGDEI